MIHDLKILPEYFTAVACGVKTFEVRKDDRLFEVGDILHLREFDGQKYTGREVKAEVTYILCDAAYCKADYVILGIKVAQQLVVENISEEKALNSALTVEKS